MKSRSHIIGSEFTPTAYVDILGIHVTALYIAFKRIVFPVDGFFALPYNIPELDHLPAWLQRLCAHLQSPIFNASSTQQMARRRLLAIGPLADA